MEDNHINSPENLSSRYDKNKHFKEQFITVYKSFFDSPKTMKEVDKETGIMRESICWYCKELRRLGKLFAIEKRRCSVTRCYNVTAWSTNPIYANPIVQLNLFDL